jgi:hypothetical protein
MIGQRRLHAIASLRMKTSTDVGPQAFPAPGNAAANGPEADQRSGLE